MGRYRLDLIDANPAAWGRICRYTQPEFSSSAVITDIQRETLDGSSLEIPGTSAALAGMRKVLDAYRRKHKPIVHIVRIYKHDGSNVDICRREAVEGGAAILLADSRR